MSKKYIYINGKKSVEVEYGADNMVVDVYIDGVKHQFKEEIPEVVVFAHFFNAFLQFTTFLLAFLK